MTRTMLITLATAFILSTAPATPAALASDNPTAAEARAIAKEAYIYGFPLVDNYRVIHTYFVDAKTPNTRRRGTRSTASPASLRRKTRPSRRPIRIRPIRCSALDLRAEPMVLTVPAVEKGRYYSIQLIDVYTHNFAYIGSRATGNGGRQFRRRRTELEGPGAERRREGDPLGNRAGACRLPHATLQSRRHRQRQEDSGRLQSAAAVGVPWQGGTQAPRHRSHSSSRSRPQTRRLRCSSSTS